MIKRLCILNLKRFWRLLCEIGILRSLFLLALSAFLIFFIYRIIFLYNPFYSVLANAIILFSFHNSRKDKEFLSIVKINKTLLFSIEYFIISLPFIISFLLTKNWYAVVVLLFLIYLISIIKRHVKFKISKPLEYPFISQKIFEWYSGIRYNLPYLFIVYLIALVFCIHLYIIPISILLLSLILSSFFIRTEPVSFIDVFQISAKKFLNMKLKCHLLYSFIFILPLIVIFSIIHPADILIVIISSIVYFLVQLYSIILKYAFYTPNSTSEHNYIFIFLFLLGFIVPVFLPISIYFFFTFYNKAINILNNFLYDYN